MRGRRYPPLEERFWSKVQKSDGCWEWTAAIGTSGYGQFCLVLKRPEHAHRVAWKLTRGAISSGEHVLHRCDNRKCVRPEHLFLGTNADNVRDKMAKGRHPRIRQPGELHGNSKLTDEAVREIRRLAARKIPQRRIAAQFGVMQQTVSGIVRGKAWKHVADDEEKKVAQLEEMRRR